MKLSELKEVLRSTESLKFQQENGKKVPAHFHITEVGKISKEFMDCGGTLRQEMKVSLQLWSSIDLHHRLSASKLLKIIELSEEKLGLEDSEIEVEYQAETIGKFGLDFKDGIFLLTGKKTACLAEEACGIPVINVLQDVSSAVKEQASSCCTPGGGCC